MLVETDSQRRMTRAKVHEAVGEILRGHDPKSLKIYTDSAINRLLKSAIRRWPNDEFCLSHAEVTRLGEFKTRSALAEVDLVTAIEEISRVLLTGRALQNAVEIDFARCIRSATDAVLFERSQAFAMAVHKGELAVLAETDFGSTLNSVLSQHSLPKSKEINWISLLKSGVRQILTSDVLAIQSYLRSLADSYTLLAFLRQTPDVQGAVEKMFSHGKLWLDTTIVLPLIADTLESEADSRGRFSRMIEAARSAGLELYATRGVTEEVERHMNKALTCARMQSGFWEGPIPFLLQRYIAAGRSADSFNGWLENFRGEAHPQEDLEDYLENELHIRIRSLESEAQSMSDELRHGLQKILLERYQKREERYGTTLDENAVTRLVSHDIECFAGVLGLRGQRRISPFGYDEWWLTVDRQAYSLCGRLASYVSGRIPESPVMSADFLINYLAFGPLRKKVGKSKESRLPVLMTHSASHLTPELLEEARILRERYRELPERVIQRTVRDQLNRARAQVGPIANMGMDDDDEFLR